MFQLDVLCHRLSLPWDPLPDGPDGDVRPVRLVSDQQRCGGRLLVRSSVQGYVSTLGDFRSHLRFLIE